MSLKDNLARMAATLAAMVQTRLELVSVELEEELLRFSSYLLFTLITLFCAGVAIALGIVLILAVCWDEHRIAALLCLIGLFSSAGILIAVWLRHQFTNRPGLLRQSLAEFKKDAELLQFQETENQDAQS